MNIEDPTKNMRHAHSIDSKDQLRSMTINGGYFFFFHFGMASIELHKFNGIQAQEYYMMFVCFRFFVVEWHRSLA